MCVVIGDSAVIFEARILYFYNGVNLDRMSKAETTGVCLWVLSELQNLCQFSETTVAFFFSLSILIPWFLTPMFIFQVCIHEDNVSDFEVLC